MNVLGISALSHDAAVTFVSDGKIRFAAHAERYSRIKNDAELNDALIAEALSFGKPDLIAWYERPFIKKSRQFFAGQFGECFRLSDIPSVYLKKFPALRGVPVEYVPHHDSHAAAGFSTSPFEDACVVVVDAIGEWGTLSIGEYDAAGTLKWHSESVYPHSLGLLYSAFTQRVGLKPNEEEYILMGMAAYGEPTLKDRIKDDFVESFDPEGLGLRLSTNVHMGIGQWCPEASREDVAASVQAFTEDIMLEIVRWTAAKCKSKNLILMGGVALNCVANEKIARFWEGHSGRCDRIWIMPNPGDGGNSLGAAARILSDMGGGKVDWRGPYLGHDIERPLDIDAAVDALAEGRVIAVANGRAEFGPRALGHRSILCDPRGKGTKDKVNEIKRRDKFRPFAPAVLEEHCSRYFDLPVARSPYMQFTAPCLDREGLPAVCHVDGSARVQTVGQEDSPVFRRLIEAFHSRTGCPILLNTSMNIKGEPLVDTVEHAERFAKTTGVMLF